jgi:hypothetical protein
MVKQEPVAWVVFADDGSESVYVALLKEQAEAAAADYGWNIAPLYRSPALTDAEREAIQVCAAAANNPGEFRPALYRGDQIAVTLRGLLERLK